LAHDWLGRLNTVIHYTSSYIFNPGAGGDLRTDIQGAYALMNLSGGVGPASGAYEVGFYIDNLTGRRYYETRAIGSLGIDAMPAAPRTYGARVTFRF
jgi:iron complex outermembrane receptor protein